MSSKRKSLFFAALMFLATSPLAYGQILSQSRGVDFSGPFIEPDYFDPDFQFFAPAEVDEYGLRSRGNYGFYGSYDRVYLNVGRSDIKSGPNADGTVARTEGGDTVGAVSRAFSLNQGDFTWGNRFEVGFTTEDGDGWNAVLLHLDGPNVVGTNHLFDQSDGVNQDRIATINGSLVPITDRQTFNEARYTSVEINRFLGRKDLHHGGVLEPFVGMSLQKFSDTDQRTSYLIIDIDGDGVYDQDRLYRYAAQAENNMLGGQLGLRWFKHSGHWRLSNTARFFGAQNFQHADGNYGGSLIQGANTTVPVLPTYIAFRSHSEFVWGGEARGEAAYALTRSINLRVGFSAILIGQGLSRVAITNVSAQSINTAPTFNGRQNAGIFEVTRSLKENLFIGGVTFGIDINR